MNNNNAVIASVIKNGQMNVRKNKRGVWRLKERGRGFVPQNSVSTQGQTAKSEKFSKARAT